MNLAPHVLAAVVVVFVGSLSCSPASNLGARCTKNEECNVEENHEQCSTSSFFSPPCKTGNCECQPSYTNEFPQKSCVEKKYLRKLGMPCNGTFEEVVTIPRAGCVNNSLACIEGSMLDAGNKKCIVSLMCDSQRRGDVGQQCPDGTSCGFTDLCECAIGKKWDQKLLKCVPRELNDRCRNDEDCRFPNPGIENYDILGYVVYPQGKCVKGKCSCPEFGYKQAGVGYIGKNGKLKRKTICVAIDALVDRPFNESCVLDPIHGNPDVVLEPPICSDDFTCARCLLDTDQVSVGLCRKVTSQASRLGSPSEAFTVIGLIWAAMTRL